MVADAIGKKLLHGTFRGISLCGIPFLYIIFSACWKKFNKINNFVPLYGNICYNEKNYMQ